MTLFGGIEGGGTKFICALAEDENHIIDETRFPTGTPFETVQRITEFFQKHLHAGKSIQRIGLANFGPIDPVLGSSTYGKVLATPKPGWTNFDIVKAIESTLLVPVTFDTDVNGAALAEAKWGAGSGLEGVLYLTIGTGIGGGYYINGKVIHGMLHPEMGHILIPQDFVRDPFPGSCPFHADCFEGLANGPALEKRWGQKAETLAADHPAWKLEAEYISLALFNYILILSPRKIILGGGVSKQIQMMPMIHARVKQLLNGYVHSDLVNEEIENYIVQPGLGEKAGILGALALAMVAESTKKE